MDDTASVEFNQELVLSYGNKSSDMIIVVDPDNISVVQHAPHCSHFSIRGFVAEVKKRDPNLCDPFSRHGYDARDSIEEPLLMLPPREVPNFPRLDSVEIIPEATDVGPSSTANEEQEVPVMTAPTVLCFDRKGKGKAYPEYDLPPPTGCENGVNREANIADENRGEKARIALPDLNECTEEHEKNDNDGLVNPSIVLSDDNGTEEPSDGSENPKVRLLTELRDSNNNNKTPLSFVSRSCKSTRKRNVVSRDEKSPKSMEIKDLGNRNKRLRKGYKGNSERECEDKSSNKITKRRSKSSKNSLLEKKDERIKTNNVVSSSFIPLKRTKIPKASHGKGKSSDKQLASTDSVTVEKAVQNVNCDKAIDLPPKGNISALVSGIGSGILTYKRTKMPRSRKYTSKNHVPPSQKEPTVLDGLFSRMPSEIISIVETCFAFRSPDAVTTEKAVQNVNSDKVTGLPPKGNVSTSKSDINSAILTKKPRSRKKTSKNHVPGECSAVPNSEAALPTRTENKQDGSSGKGINHLPKSSSPIRNAKAPSPIPMKNGFNPPPSQADAAALVGRLSRKPSGTRSIGETSSAFRPPLATRVNANEDRIISSTLNSKGKQALVPETLKQVCDSVTNQKTEVRGRPDIDINSIPAEESEPEQENGDRDGFPAEIVELLARYPKALRNYVENVRSNGNDYGENTPMFGQSHILSMPKPLATDPPSVLQSYNRLQGSSSPRPNIEAHAWPPSRMHMGITNPNMMSQSSSVSLNKETAHHPSHNFKRGGSVDLYSNKALSAMQLLNMMQRTANSQTWEEISRRSMVLPDTLQYFSNNNNHEIGQQQIAASSSRQPFLKNNERMISSQGGNHPCYPTSGFSFTTSLQNNARMGINPRFISPVTLTSNGERSIASSHLAAPRQPHSSSLDKGKGIMSSPSSVNPLQGANNSGFTSPIPLTANRQRIIESSHFATPRQSGFSSLDKGKGIMSSPSSVSPLQGAKNSQNNMFGSGTKRDERTVSKAPRTEICVVNRNPSEFDDPRESRKYLIRPRGEAKKQENNSMTKKHTHTAKKQRKS